MLNRSSVHPSGHPLYLLRSFIQTTVYTFRKFRKKEISWPPLKGASFRAAFIVNGIILLQCKFYFICYFSLWPTTTFVALVRENKEC